MTTLWQINIPQVTNSGSTYAREIQDFEKFVAHLAGGFSKTAGRGCWLDNGKLYNEAILIYQIACHNVQIHTIFLKASELFYDQLAIFTAKLGDAEIVKR